MTQTQPAGKRMVELVNNLLESMTPEQASVALRPEFGNELERRNWDYVPRIRTGLSLSDMTRKQRKLTHRLVASGLAVHAYAQVAMLMGLEDVLDELEGGVSEWSGLDYLLLVFGRPGESPWGWRFEGHHVSLNYTLLGEDIISCTPLFFGSNPGVITQGGAEILRLLAREENLAREFVRSLSAELQSSAIVRGEAPIEIRTGNLPMVGGFSTTGGITASQLKGRPGELFRSLVDNYVSRLPGELAATRSASLWKNGGEDVTFSWEGSLEPGRAHYYCITGPGFLLEYDNSQHEANHIHTVYRDPANDFADDVLREHLLAYPHPDREIQASRGMRQERSKEEPVGKREPSSISASSGEDPS